MEKFDIEKIERDAVISSIMVGNCPKCGSDNAHNCSALKEVPAREVAGFKIPKRTMGYNCPVALRIDDPCVGHCDNCNYIWCLECGTELLLKSHRCPHWGEVCAECENEGEKCEYTFVIHSCPKIKKWLEK